MIEDGPDRSYQAIVGMDPQADWLLNPPALGLYLPNPEAMLVPFVIRLEDDVAAAAFRRLAVWCSLYPRDDEPLADEIYVPCEIDPTAVDVGRSVPGFALLSFFQALARPERYRRSDVPEEQVRETLEQLRAAAKRIELSRPDRSSPSWRPGVPLPDVRPVEAVPPDAPCERPIVVMGVIDDGFGFAHRRFRRADGSTRIASFWQMDGRTPSPTVDTGTELLAADIDGLILAWGDDEERLYREAGVVAFADPTYHRNAQARRVSHGTHVLDLAAGFDAEDDRVDRPIIAVQLPAADTANPVTGLLNQQITRALLHVLLRAQTLYGANVTVVVNCSYGLFAGPHDGGSVLERTIDQQVQAFGGRLRVVLPAGNGHLERCHAAVDLANLTGEATTEELVLRVPPDDRTLTHVEIWAPTGVAGLEVTVTLPDGTTFGPVDDTGPNARLIVVGGRIVGLLSHLLDVSASLTRRRFALDLMPTEAMQTATSTFASPLARTFANLAPVGLWRLRIHRVGGPATGIVHAWVQRDEAPFGHPRRGRQAYFDDPEYDRFDAIGRPLETDPSPGLGSPVPVQRAGMISGIATGAETLVAAALVRRQRRLAAYSAGGTIEGDIRRPNVALEAELSLVHRGLMAAGTRSGVRAALGGTSIAAPRLARLVADAVTAAGQLPGPGAVALPADLADLPPARAGAGQLALPPVAGPQRIVE